MSHTKINLRPWRAKDLTAIVNRAGENGSAWTVNQFELSLASGDLGWVLEIDNDQCSSNFDRLGAGLEIMGFLLVKPCLDFYDLLDIFIASQYRGQGLAGRLLNSMILHAQQHNIPRILLEVRCSNQIAANLYTKHGFKIISYRRDYYPVSTNGREDGLVMEWNCIP